MSVRALGVGILVAMGVLAPVGPASADTGLITFRVQGTLESQWALTGVDAPGPYVLDYTFDPATAASSSSAGSATYDAVTSMQMSIDGTPIASTPYGSITVSDAPGGYRYRADFGGLTALSGAVPPPAQLDSIAVQVGSDTADLTTGLGLPSVPPPDRTMPDGSGGYPLELLITSCTSFPFGGSICQQAITLGSIDSITGFGAGIDHPVGGPRAFDDGAGTFGQVLAGTGILVEDAAAPGGVRITTTGTAELQMCADAFAVSLVAGSDVTYTCGSVTAKVATGATRIGMGPGSFVTVPAGGSVTVDRTSGGAYSVVNNGTVPVNVTRGGVVTALPGGATAFSAPQTKDDCKKGGWAAYGVFKNQGSCVSSLAHS